MFNLKVLDADDIDSFIEQNIQPHYPEKHVSLTAHPILRLTGESKIACMVCDREYTDVPITISTLKVQNVSSTTIAVDIEHLVQFMIDSGTIPEDEYFVYYKW